MVDDLSIVRRARLCFSGVLPLLLLSACRVAVPLASAEPTHPKPVTPAKKCPVKNACEKRAENPARTIIERPCGTPFAVLTDGARSVLLTGRQRTFNEASAGAPVMTRDWVRLLPRRFDGRVDDSIARWLETAATEPSADVLAIATEYLDGAPVRMAKGAQIAGDAAYGAFKADGKRAEGADFNDYLGIVWHYPGGDDDEPEAEERGALDCSGFIRMVWGFRLGFPLARGSRVPAGALPRRSFELAAAPVGAIVIPDSGKPTQELERLQAGDVVFFDADDNDGPQIDHVGIVLGRDTRGHLRFISSRKSANGPTFGDIRGPSILDGSGLYARSLRSARRF